MFNVNKYIKKNSFFQNNKNGKLLKNDGIFIRKINIIYKKNKIIVEYIQHNIF